MDDVAGRLATLRRRRGDGARLCMAVRDLVVVCSSSRGGSSLFGELLRRSPDLLTFSAEINPHVTIATLASGGGCDTVSDPMPVAGTADGLEVLRGELGNDLGRGGRHLDLEAFVDHVTWRLTMQWPLEPIDRTAVARWVAEALPDAGSPSHGLPDRTAFAFALLARAREEHPAINPYRYDLRSDAVADRFRDAAVPTAPPPEPIVEMAPFVLPRAWDMATLTQAATMPVVATTPRNAFRLDLLAAAFPNATLRMIHLTRNPAAAVNGLRDGWLHHGFFSCRSSEPLDITGYTDRFPGWGDRWWSYDVPPGWRAWTQRSLVEVCAFQWCSAHEAVLDASARYDTHRVAFEDVAGAADRRTTAMTNVCEWLGVDPAPVTADDALPVVMPTERPRPRRWADNHDVLAPVVDNPAVLDTAVALGYSGDIADWA